MKCTCVWVLKWQLRRSLVWRHRFNLDISAFPGDKSMDLGEELEQSEWMISILLRLCPNVISWRIHGMGKKCTKRRQMYGVKIRDYFLLWRKIWDVACWHLGQNVFQAASHLGLRSNFKNYFHVSCFWGGILLCFAHQGSVHTELMVGAEPQKGICVLTQGDPAPSLLHHFHFSVWPHLRAGLLYKTDVSIFCEIWILQALSCHTQGKYIPEKITNEQVWKGHEYKGEKVKVNGMICMLDFGQVK